MNIITIIYNFDYQMVVIHGPYEITKETEKCYFFKDEFSNRKILKSEIGQIRERSAYGGSPPYLQLSMIDINEKALRENLSKWFADKAHKVLNG